ncbi:MAG: dihydroorotase, partial [Gemmatimonadaceae bacterium]
MKPILLRGGTVVDPSQKMNERGDLLVSDGKISAVGRTIDAPDDAEIIDCAGLIVSPGFIDVHCHLREPGR